MKETKFLNLFIFVVDNNVLKRDMNLLPPREWSNVNMLAHISSNYHLSRADVTKDKTKEYEQTSA